MTPSRTVTRFAPSPTGYLHLGQVRSALEGWQAARRDCGRFLLRLEDIDLTRCREEYAMAIIEDLGWLGLLWDGAVRKRSEHFDDYRRALGQLEAIGVLYPCICTRREIQEEIRRAGGAPQGEGGAVYPGTSRHLEPASRADRVAAGADYALRLDLTAALGRTGPLHWSEDGRWIAAEPELLGDVVLARKDVPASYHLAVTLDDALQRVTLVTRGADLFTATHIHRLLQALLGLMTRARFPSLSASLDYARRECAAAPATIELLIGGFYAVFHQEAGWQHLPVLHKAGGARLVNGEVGTDRALPVGHTAACSRSSSFIKWRSRTIRSIAALASSFAAINRSKSAFRKTSSRQ
jgi:glutamyl-Q tRNA(Asp) synthetase